MAQMALKPRTAPFELFREWFAEAEAKVGFFAKSTALATATPDAAPSVRMVIVQHYDERGFCFYTNLGSRKAQELSANPKASICFFWQPLEKQVRVEGSVEPVTQAEADTYFASRPHGSKVGAWASKQSQPLVDRGVLENRREQFSEKYPEDPVPRPEFWSGFRLVPSKIEFWQDGEFRLHRRTEYSLNKEDSATEPVDENEYWRCGMLFP